MNIKNKLENNTTALAVIGMGYVGMPLAAEFSKHYQVIGFDINKTKINNYKNGIDPTNELGADLKQSKIFFTYDENDLKNANFFVVAVPTPVNLDKTPDLTPVIEASKLVGRNIGVNSIVCYESTVYPGGTEEVCVPIIEKVSGLKAGKDFFVGYSPERINPSDKIHKLVNIKKIVSGQNESVCKEIAAVYGKIIKAGVYPVSSIKTAEAAKVAENSQRDINIAFMNELAKVFNIMGIDTNEVVDAMNTKWNALGFRPGLVGGHCISVDPYYFVYKAEKLGYHSQIIMNGRQVNDSMGVYVADETVRKLIEADKLVKTANVFVFGITFKENCNDVRNSKVVDIINRLKEYGIKPQVYDPIADKGTVHKAYNINLIGFDKIYDADAIILAVAHDEFKNLNIEELKKLYRNEKRVLIDVKGLYNKKTMQDNSIIYWNL